MKLVKKGLLMSVVASSMIALFGFTTPDSNIIKIDNEITVSAPTLSTVQVCRITPVGPSGWAKNCEFTGKYDEDENYIWIYNKKGEEVSSGRVRNNPYYDPDSRSSRARYPYCQGDYYFNL